MITTEADDKELRSLRYQYEACSEQLAHCMVVVNEWLHAGAAMPRPHDVLDALEHWPDHANEMHALMARAANIRDRAEFEHRRK